MRGIYTEDVLRNVYKCPCRGTGEPAVLALAVDLRIASRNPLAVNVRLGLVNL